MPLYECVYIARQDISASQVEALTTQFSEILTEGGGTVPKMEYWGLRSLSYRIKKNRKGHYVLMNIDAPHPAVAEMERQMSLNEDVLRVLTIRVDKLEEGPSAMMRSRGERDDRRGGRGGRDRSDRGERSERPERGDRPERVEKPERGEKPERAEKSERVEKPERAETTDRPPVTQEAGE